MFLEGVKSALTADAAFKEGWYTEKPAKGLRAAARVYAGWGFSQAFYWEQEYKKMGYSLARGLPRRLLGGLLPRPPRPEQPADDAVDLAERQCRRDARASTATRSRR